jgi:hypothetical protein
MSPTPSSISNSNSAASGASTKSRRREKSGTIGGGWTESCNWYVQAWSWRWARPQYWHSPGSPSRSRAFGGGQISMAVAGSSQCTRPICSVCPTERPRKKHIGRLWETCEVSVGWRGELSLRRSIEVAGGGDRRVRPPDPRGYCLVAPVALPALVANEQPGTDMGIGRGSIRLSVATGRGFRSAESDRRRGKKNFAEGVHPVTALVLSLRRDDGRSRAGRGSRARLRTAGRAPPWARVSGIRMRASSPLCGRSRAW